MTQKKEDFFLVKIAFDVHTSNKISIPLQISIPDIQYYGSIKPGEVLKAHKTVPKSLLEKNLDFEFLVDLGIVRKKDTV